MSPNLGPNFGLYAFTVFSFLGKMERVLKADTERIRLMAFRQQKRCSSLLTKFHKLKRRIDSSQERDGLWKVYDWLLVPFSLWPIDFEGLASYLLECMGKNVPLDEELRMLLRTIDEPKAMQACSAIEAFERSVQSGDYESVIRQPAKFAEVEESTKLDDQFHRCWREVKRSFKVARFKNRQGVIRRRLAQERNFRPDWKFDWTDEKQKFKVLFDALCHRWHLYGVEDDKPLLMKVSVNPTAYGTMIVIPGHWSFDNKRDLDWLAIKRLHRVHGAVKQGPKLSPGRIERHREAQNVLKLWIAAAKLGRRGNARCEYVFESMGMSAKTDSSYIKRMLRLARKRIAQDPA